MEAFDIINSSACHLLDDLNDLGRKIFLISGDATETKYTVYACQRNSALASSFNGVLLQDSVDSANR